MINFDKNKYPLDHEWIDIFQSKDESLTRDVFIIHCYIECIKCKITVFHKEISSKVKNLHFYKQLCVNDKGGHILYDAYDDAINYEKIYSCSEMAIKRLLE